jgi:hypothetical protein
MDGFVAAEICVEFANGSKRLFPAAEVKRFIDGGLIARIYRRKRGNLICAVSAKAMPGEIASMSHRTPTVARVLPSTWAHNNRACAGYRGVVG